MATGEQRIKHIWVITGPAGCGKSTIGSHLAGALELPYLEGDEFHTAQNVQKMHAGIPLEDSDRWEWLIKLREAAVNELLSGKAGVILACSALKRKYRDVLRIASYFNSDIATHFVFLDANETILLERVKARQGHYMKENLVHSQFESLERPSADEKDCFAVDVSGTSLHVQEAALHAVTRALQNTVMKTHAVTAV